MSKKLKPIERLMLAMDRCAWARGEANWTNGYRAASNLAEQERLLPKEKDQWDRVEQEERKFRRSALRVLREVSHV